MPLRMVLLFQLILFLALAYGIWDETVDREKVFMELNGKEFTVSDEVRLSLKNNDSREVWLGKPYSLERYNGENWEKVPLERVFTMEIIVLAPGETYRQLIPLNEINSLDEGDYRVKKNVLWPEMEESFTVQAEFEILSTGS